VANLSDLTRKEQILEYLRSHKGEWVNGTDIMNEEVGGQRGGARIKDLRDDGYVIFSRKHPDPERDIWQYQIVEKPVVTTTPLRPEATPRAAPVDPGPRMIFGTHRLCHSCRAMRKNCNACGGKGYVLAPPGT